jgi:hypothetical protein
VIIKEMQVSELIPASYNPRQISDEALSGLKHSIDKFGLVEPIIFNKTTGNVVGGHQRLKILKTNGTERTQCVIVELDESEEKALNITLNNQNIQGEFTEDLQGLLSKLETEIPEFEDLKLDLLIADLDTDFIDETSTDKDGMGFDSSWEQVGSRDSVKVIFGSIELRVPIEPANRIFEYLEKKYKSEIPYSDTFLEILLNGIENSDS